MSFSTKQILGVLFVVLFLSSIAVQVQAQQDSKTPQAQKSALEQVLEGAEKPEGNVYTIYMMDVFSYYDLEEKYNTDLKKKVFKKTAEYGDKLNKLRKIRQKMLRKRYYVVIEDEFPDYDIKRRGFDIFLGRNTGFGTIEARPPK